ncbi:MAG: SUF system NifU family Fe-S cluster assembly protein [Acidimicrobiales bacterium]|nr:SUF system NifU family Fe-S cluster assembly protein [Acidimicrobiales bacterium]
MSGLEDLYREIILDHYRNPRNRGTLESPPAIRQEGFNPLCGDEVIVYLEKTDEGNNEPKLVVRIDGRGCSISQSSASLMAQSVNGSTVPEVRKLIKDFKSLMSIHETNLGGEPEDEASLDPVDTDKMGELAALQGVVKFPVRIKCATLSWNTLLQAMEELEI